jgi:peptidoglycan/LPS O-acetylase OafA/YrhL
MALAASWLLVVWFGKPPPQGRYVSIDGLRGYLALAVFISHIPVWYVYCRSGTWSAPPSRIYTNFGQTGVTLFFMITGFLFYSKLIDGRKKPVDWNRLYVSRLLRLWPLYLFAILIVLSVVAVLSGGTLRVPFGDLIGTCANWLTFSFLGRPEVNGVKDTSVIIAGVTWSLAYEWYFYWSLPLLSLTVGTLAPKRYILLSLLAMYCMYAVRPLPIFVLAFAGGMIASGLVRSKSVCRVASRPVAAVLAVACIGLTVTLFSTAYEPLPIGLLAVAFVIVACGNSLFGALTSGVSRMLGDMSYSIYLLQGIILFFAYGFDNRAYDAAALTPTQHCFVGIACVPTLVFVSFATYRLIEQPAMRRVPRVISWMNVHVRAGRRAES